VQKAFIEEQFPVSLISKESYKERKAGAGQTLTGLGKWWGRKPLILVRAVIIGLLMSASSDPKKDREIFLKILTMDADGLWQRCKGVTAKSVYEWSSDAEKEKYFNVSGKSVRWNNQNPKEERDRLTRKYFDSLSYDEKLEYCDRPEQVGEPKKEAWVDINAHLGTSASSINELVKQLGEKRFGHVPRVGDAFCGGGSIPFEAARIGCEAYGSDLNPVAALLTWASLNIVGGSEETQNKIREAQEKAFDEVDKQITEWGIEHNEKGWRADAYLYCIEAKSPATGYWVPLAPSWIIAEKNKTVAVLIPDHDNKRYKIEIVENADQETYNKAKEGTVKKGRLICPETGDDFAISEIRGDRIFKVKSEKSEVKSRGVSRNARTRDYGLRLWENEDLVPRPDDVFQERLYCVRWVETYTDEQDREKMLAIDDKDEPNFGDTDYQLAAYAAALRVLTQYGEIEGMDIKHELFRERGKGEKSEFEKVIDRAVEIACNHLVPEDFAEFHWKSLTADERLYLKGVELEKHGEFRNGAYQELAKGFGVRDYNFLYAKTKSNEARFKTASEFKRTNLKGDGFDLTLVRHLLFAIHETVSKETVQEGLNYLKVEVTDYWSIRKRALEILRYLSRLEHIPHLPHWKKDAEAARVLAGAVENDHG
jgi:adenine-specific DNA methylase